MVPSSAAPPPTSVAAYLTAYGPAFGVHALLAVVAWTVLAPLGHVLSRMRRRAAPHTAHQLHRALMLAAAAFTAAAYVLAVGAHGGAAPLAHRALGSALLCAVALQAGVGALRPPPTPGCAMRSAWRHVHTAFGAAVMSLGAFVVHHSMVVFHVRGWPTMLVNAAIAVAAAIVLAVNVLVRREEGEEWRNIEEEDAWEWIEESKEEDATLEEGQPQWSPHWSPHWPPH